MTPVQRVAADLAYLGPRPGPCDCEIEENVA